MYYPDFWAWFCRLVSMPALFLRDAHSGGSFCPSPIGNVSRGPWRCCQGLDAAGSVFLYRESERGGENLPCSICHGLELFEQVPSSPPFQALRSWECCCGCTLGVVRHRGKHHSLCANMFVNAIMFAASAWLEGHNVFSLAKPCDSYWLQAGLLTCGNKIKCHCQKFLQTFLGLLSLVVPGPVWKSSPEEALGSRGC